MTAPAEWVAEFNAAELELGLGDAPTCGIVEVPPRHAMTQSLPAYGPPRWSPADLAAFSAAAARLAPPGATAPAPDADPLVAEVLAEVLAQVKATLAEPTPLLLDPPGLRHRAKSDVARIAELEAQLAKARRAMAFFTTAAGPDVDVEAWLLSPDGDVAQLGSVARAGAEQVSASLEETAQLRSRAGALETALRDLVARVEGSGGYADPEEQDVLWRACQALADGGL